MLVATLNTEKSMFLTGLLPTVADFELAYLVDHFKWICEKNQVVNPFNNFKNLRSIYDKVRGLDGVREYIEQEEVEGKRWFDEGKTVHERYKIVK